VSLAARVTSCVAFQLLTCQPQGSIPTSQPRARLPSTHLLTHVLTPSPQRLTTAPPLNPCPPPQASQVLCDEELANGRTGGAKMASSGWAGREGAGTYACAEWSALGQDRWA
jgi:hypothetical protein